MLRVVLVYIFSEDKSANETTEKKGKQYSVLFIGNKGDKDQETIQSSTIPDPGYHMGK